MKLPCAVVRDLLPLYAEHLTEGETTAMVDEHLEGCAACRQRLAEIDTKLAAPVESAKPLIALKKEIKKRRWLAAAIAALCVFAAVFTWFSHVNEWKLVPWEEGLIEVARVGTVGPAAAHVDGADVSGAGETEPAPTAVPAPDGEAREALILRVSSFINGFQEHVIVEDDGTTTVLMQAISSNPVTDRQARSYYEMTYTPVPDCLIYGFEQPQQLLWGTPAGSGTVVLPRLALSYYLLIAAAAALLFGLAWAILRKWRFSWIPRQLFFAPLSYVLSQLLLKGTRTASFFLEHDLISILLLTLALYALLSLTWQVFLQRRKER